jgi:hypothetical protein
MKYELMPGTREGYTQIRFEKKPAETVRKTLKMAGYRWSRYNGVWYGLTDDLPELFKADPNTVDIPEDTNGSKPQRRRQTQPQTTVRGNIVNLG